MHSVFSVARKGAFFGAVVGRGGRQQAKGGMWDTQHVTACWYNGVCGKSAYWYKDVCGVSAERATEPSGDERVFGHRHWLVKPISRYYPPFVGFFVNVILVVAVPETEKVAFVCKSVSNFTVAQHIVLTWKVKIQSSTCRCTLAPDNRQHRKTIVSTKKFQTYRGQTKKNWN